MIAIGLESSVRTEEANIPQTGIRKYISKNRISHGLFIKGIVATAISLILIVSGSRYHVHAKEKAKGTEATASVQSFEQQYKKASNMKKFGTYGTIFGLAQLTAAASLKKLRFYRTN